MALIIAFLLSLASGIFAQEPTSIWRVDLHCSIPLPGAVQEITFGYTVVADTLSREALAVFLETRSREIKYEIFAAQVRRAAKLVRDFHEEVIPIPEPAESPPSYSAPPWFGDGTSHRGEFKWEGRAASVVITRREGWRLE